MGMKKGARRARIVEELVVRNGRTCWAARILAVLFIFFMSVIALDVFSSGGNFLEVFLSLIIHLIPSIILFVLLVVSWKCERIGGPLFIVLGIIFTLFFNTYKDGMTFTLISLPVFLIGVLFWVGAEKKS